MTVADMRRIAEEVDRAWAQTAEDDAEGVAVAAILAAVVAVLRRRIAAAEGAS